jgi:streptogramin lyase/pimeloyl-ACP methyl ester carboxylesterase
MMDLLERADPGARAEIDVDRLRSLVDERIGLTRSLEPSRQPLKRPWIAAFAAFAAVLAVAVPILLRFDDSLVVSPDFVPSIDQPGFDRVVPLASGGVQTMAIDGDTAWVMTSLQNSLQRVSLSSGVIEASYTIDGYTEGVSVGGGYVWLRSYDNGGLLRFNPELERVDLAIPLEGQPAGGAGWFSGALWPSTDQGVLYQISANGEILSQRPGIAKGQGLGHLWFYDPVDGSIRTISESGAEGAYSIEGDGPAISDLSEVRDVREAGGYLWLTTWGTPDAVVRFDPENGELLPLRAGRRPHGMTELDGQLWVSSHVDHELIRIDPESGETRHFPVAGKPGGIEAVNGDLWVLLFHPGALVRVDPDADLIESGAIVPAFTGGGSRSHSLHCTLGGVDEATRERVLFDQDFDGLGPTILLEPAGVLGHGTWSVIQARLSAEGYVVCSSGHLDEEGTPEERAADLDTALIASGIPGPYLLVSNLDGVHSARLFAAERDDVAGMVLVNPIPLGFQEFHDDLLPEFGHQPWLDLDPTVSAAVGSLDSTPLVVIGQSPDSTFLAERYISGAGLEAAEAEAAYWQRGLDFYVGLSTESRFVLAPSGGFDRLIWDEADLVVDEILALAKGG